MGVGWGVPKGSKRSWLFRTRASLREHKIFFASFSYIKETSLPHGRFPWPTFYCPACQCFACTPTTPTYMALWHSLDTSCCTP